MERKILCESWCEVLCHILAMLSYYMPYLGYVILLYATLNLIPHVLNLTPCLESQSTLVPRVQARCRLSHYNCRLRCRLGFGQSTFFRCSILCSLDYWLLMKSLIDAWWIGWCSIWSPSGFQSLKYGSIGSASGPLSLKFHSWWEGAVSTADKMKSLTSH